MNLTEAWLSGAAGWQVVKEAKGLWSTGAVVEANYTGKVLKGVVLAGGRRMVAGLKIESAADLQNLCGCSVSRQSGRVCVHSAAIALAVIKGNTEAPKPAPAAPSPAAPAPAPRTDRGGVRVVFDARLLDLWNRGRIPVRFLPAENDTHAALWPWLEKAGIRSLPATGTLTPDQADGLLRLLAGKPGTQLGEDALAVESSPAGRLRVKLRRNGGNISLTPYSWSATNQKLLLGGNNAWLFLPEQNTLQPLRPAPSGEAAFYRRLLDQVVKTKPDTLEILASRLLESIAAWQDCLEFEQQAGAELKVQAAPVKFRLRLEGSLNALSGILTLQYSDRVSFRAGQEPPASAFPLQDAESGTFLVRNLSAEVRASDAMQDAGFTGPDADGQFQLRGEDTILRFVATTLPRLREAWDVELGERFQHVLQGVQVIRPRYVPTAADNQWLHFSIQYQADDGFELSRQDIRRLLDKSQTKVQLPNGKVAAIDLAACEEANEVLYDVQPRQEGEGFRARAAHAGFLQLALGHGQLVSEERVPLEDLGDLRPVLRGYQAEGITWMLQRLLAAAGSCLLADEMGLGKTLQTLATLELLLQKEGGQALVVCPTSLLTNWRLETERFLPGRKVHILHGPGRWEQTRAIGQADILITSYALLARDGEHWQSRPLAAAVLDEASQIKNPDTKNAQAARALNAKHRIALTGTPLENSVRELWSIFEYLVPGYLGSRGEFRERYEAPVASGAAPRPVLERLRKRVRPLLLRRLKEDVAKDLPAKLEQVRYCELTPKQAALYEAILRESRQKIDDAESDGQKRMTMLTALLRLRQVCCEPRLLKLRGAEADCGKLDLFDELLEETLGGHHRALIFSQFTGLLGILRERLKENKVDYCYLDGASTDRAEQVATFQRPDGPPVFLISLKAGGYGLNLTAADTVIHYDPWWNPAVEAQATDRAHRIGQTRPVTAYKLITTGTVEERILALQRRKKAIIDAALEDGEPLMQGLTADELREVIG